MVRHRTRQTKGCGSRSATLGMAYKPGRECELTWRRLNSHQLMSKIIQAIRFADGVKILPQAAQPPIQTRLHRGHPAAHSSTTSGDFSISHTAIKLCWTMPCARAAENISRCFGTFHADALAQIPALEQVLTSEKG